MVVCEVEVTSLNSDESKKKSDKHGNETSLSRERQQRERFYRAVERCQEKLLHLSVPATLVAVHFVNPV